MVEHLPSKHKTLNSNPRTPETRVRAHTHIHIYSTSFQEHWDESESSFLARIQLIGGANSYPLGKEGTLDPKSKNLGS
jgi:hypothetical protein